MVTVSIEKNTHGEEGISFIGDNGDNYPFIPFRQLLAEEDYQLPHESFTTHILSWPIRITKHTWCDSEVVKKFMKVMTEKFPKIDNDLLIDTFSVVSRIYDIDLMAQKFLKENPVENYQGTNLPNHSSWKKQFIEYLRSRQ